MGLVVNSFNIKVSCPRDDLESLAYILFYCVNRGSIFKSDKHSANYHKMLEKLKMEFIPENLSNMIPIEFIQFFNYIRMSNMKDYPMTDYDHFKKLFRSLMSRNGYPDKTYTYPWVKLLL